MKETRDQLRARIERASVARLSVKSLSLKERLDRLARCGQAFTAHRNELIESMVKGERLTRSFAAFQVDQSIGAVEHFESFSELITDHVFETRAGRTLVRHDPLGVVALVPPSNSPVRALFLNLGSALLAGNAVVVRPPTAAEATLTLVCELVAREWPPGAVEVSSCDATAARDEFAENKRINAVLFFGGSQMGREYLAAISRAQGRRDELGAEAPLLKKYAAELAGNDALIVLEDASIGAAVSTTVAGSFLNSGQTCVAGKRILVHRRVAEPFLDNLVMRVRALRVGDPDDPRVDIGPLGQQKHVDLLAALLRDAVAKQGKVLCGGEWDGLVFHPTLIMFDKNALLGKPEADQPRLWTQESFGPLRSVVIFDDVDEAIRLADDSRFGLGACVFGSEQIALAIAAQLDVGRVVINGNPVTTAAEVPIGGVRDSGFYGATHKIEDLCYVKRVFVPENPHRSD